MIPEAPKTNINKEFSNAAKQDILVNIYSKTNLLKYTSSTHSNLLFPFYLPKKHFWEGSKREQCIEMG